LSLLGERLLEVHAALDDAKIAHAFGGAIALAYCTQDPRGTSDVDVNVFTDPEQVDQVMDALPDGVNVRAADRAVARRDGQVRVFWQDTPIDLFWSTHGFHREIAREIRAVPFEGSTIPVLGCEALVVFKAMFNRTRDWADIEEMLSAGTFDCRHVLGRVRALLGAVDPAVVRLETLCDGR
jgi:hypothetical protein